MIYNLTKTKHLSITKDMLS